MPRFKIVVTHDSEDTTYENTASTTKVKKRENNYDTLEITLTDPFHALYGSGDIAKFDEIKAYLMDVATEEAWTQIFGGTIRQTNPSLDATNGATLTLNCKGYAAALEETHCNWDYGIESSHPTYPKPWNILTNVIYNFVNKSFTGDSTGHALDNDYISDYCDTNIKYLNNPYRANIEVIDTVCQLTSAIGAGTTAGGHYIVDNNKKFLFAKIGDHTAGVDSPEAYWPDWWNTNQAGSTLTQGVDFETFNILDKSEEYANNVVLVTDFRRPSHDYWTNSQGISDGVWTAQDCNLTAATSTPTQVVGDACLKISPTSGMTETPGYAYFRFHPTYALDVTKIGSIKTIPRLNFYSYKPAGLSETTTSVRLYTTSPTSAYYECVFSTISQDDNVWAHKSIPIGPYWKSTDVQEKNEFVWTSNSGDWTSIAGLAFKVDALSYLAIDDLHFTGKVVRSAKHSPSITAYKEYQKVLIARNAMDDSCVAEDDTGFAARIAHAELLRRLSQPVTILFTTHTDMKTAMAGQKIHVQAGKQAGGTYALNSDMRILELEHSWSTSGYAATVTATTDLTNSFAINNPDAYAMWQENMFVNSSEAKNIRAGSEVDLLIDPLIYDYGT
jgi:hypothetical protein